MSIYATNLIVDEITGEVKLIKHLNKTRIDRGTWNKSPGGWNKSGKKSRMKNPNFYNSKSDRRVFILTGKFR